MLREFLILILPFLRTLHPSCVQGFFIMDCPHQFHPLPRPPPLHIYPFPIPAKQNKKPQAHINQLEAFHPSRGIHLRYPLRVKHALKRVSSYILSK